MATYTQGQRPLEVITPLGKDVLLLEEFTGQESLAGLFRFQLDMLAPASQKIPFDELLGRDMTVVIRNGEGQVRYFSGMCSRMRQGNIVRIDDAVFVRYRAELVPHFWLWTKQVQSRIFQDQTVLDILRAVIHSLDESFKYNVDDVRSKYEPRRYCVQFQESSFDFINRVLQEEGIYYYFGHQQSEDTLRLSDQPLQHPKLPKPYDPVTFDETDRGLDEAISSWEVMQDVEATRYVVRDYHFELPQSSLEAQAKLRPKVGVGGVSLSLNYGDRLEVYDHNGLYAHRFDSIDAGGKHNEKTLPQVFEENKRFANLQVERTAAQAITIEGTSNCAGFLPGHTFGLEQPTRVQGRYLLTYVEHSARQAPYRSGPDGAFHYENRFRCIPAELAYRPPLSSPQRIHGTMTATVAGGKEGEICTDKYSRIKVRFKWDRRDENNDNNSCWVRVLQSWAGKNWGAIHVPRVGQEVIVAFEEGNPDRPIVLGSVYNAAHMPPLTLPDNANVTGVKTQTLGEEQGHSSCLLFSDKKDEEVARLHAEKSLVIDSKDEMHVAVGKEMVNMVGWSFPKVEWGHDFSSFLKMGGDLMQLLFGGSRWDLTRGTHLTAGGLLSNHYTLFSRNEIVLDPSTWAAAQITSAKWGNRMLMGKVPSGRSEMTYGNRATTGFGVGTWTHHGPLLQRLGPSKPWEKVWAIGHSASSLATCVLPFLYADSGDHGMGLAAELVNDAAGVFLAFSNIQKRQLAIAQATLDVGKVVLAMKSQAASHMQGIEIAMEAIRAGTYPAEVARTSADVHNTTVDGIYALQADRIQMLSRAAGGISLAAQTGPVFINSPDSRVTIACGTSGIQLNKKDGVEINSASLGSSVRLKDESLTLSCAVTNKITITDQKITLRSGDSTLEIGPAGININAKMIQLNGETMKVSPFSGVKIKNHFMVEGGLVDIQGAPVGVTSSGSLNIKGAVTNMS